MITATTRNDILRHVYSCSTYNQIINNVMFNSVFERHLLDDVKQELYLQVAESKTDIVNYYNNGIFDYFFASLVKNQLKSCRSQLYYTYQKKENITDEFAEHHQQTYEVDIPLQIDNKDRYDYVMSVINTHINTNSHNKRNLTIYLMYYINDMSLAEISRKTLIPKTSVHKYLNEAKELIETKIDKNLFN